MSLQSAAHINGYCSKPTSVFALNTDLLFADFLNLGAKRTSFNRRLLAGISNTNILKSVNKRNWSSSSIKSVLDFDRLLPQQQQQSPDSKRKVANLEDILAEKGECGVGFIANLDNKGSHKIVEDALTALGCMEHRGGCGADNDSGDGSGLMTSVPWDLFNDWANKQGIAQFDQTHTGVGMVFLPQDEKLMEQAKSGSSFSWNLSNNHRISRGISRRAHAQYLGNKVSQVTVTDYEIESTLLIKRRNMIGLVLSASSLLFSSLNADSAGLPPQEIPRLCDDSCEKQLQNISMVTTESGLQYKDIKVGSGPTPPVGYQVAANYVAMVPSGQVFDSSLEKRQIYIFRVGSGQVVKGLDEGILSMKAGGLRRLYVPGSLAFPKGLTSAPGRPRVAANSPVIFDVSLEYIPGLDNEDE